MPLNKRRNINHSKWASALVTSQYKLDSRVGNKVQDQPKKFYLRFFRIRSNKQSLISLNLIQKNEAKKFPRFIVLESLEETLLVKLSLFFFKKKKRIQVH